MDRLFAGGTVNAAQAGKGPPLFLFHSLLSDRASFDAIAPELAKSFSVIVPELPGFGGSKAVSGGLAGVADRMAEVVKDAARGEGATVLGNGYGGFVALQMAIRHPGIAAQVHSRRLRRGVLGTGARGVSQHGCGIQGQRPCRDHRCGDAPAVRAGIPGESHPDLMADRRAAFLKTDPEVFRAACEALAALDLRPELAGVKVPVLVVVGEHDEATPPPMSHELAALLPQAHLEIIPGCAHVPQLQSPKLFLDAIGGFLRAA